MYRSILDVYSNHDYLICKFINKWVDGLKNYEKSYIKIKTSKIIDVIITDLLNLIEKK